jgi:uncharacterized protein
MHTKPEGINTLTLYKEYMSNAFTSLPFEDLTFAEKDGNVRVILFNTLYFTVPAEELKQYGEYQINDKDKTIAFKTGNPQRVRKKILFLIDKYIDDLRNIRNNKPTIYVHKHSSIPLRGCIFFGVVDKGSGMIEVKPNTGCNISCVFCSVDEGPAGKKAFDFFVEKDYLIEEVEKVLQHKKDSVDVYINPHGDPTVYPHVVGLVRDLKQLEHVRKVVIITNGVLLSQTLIQELKDAKLDQLNVTVCTLDPKKIKQLVGVPLSISQLKEKLKLAVRSLDVVITPVMMAGINEVDMEDIIKFSKDIGCEKVSIQNYQEHKRGRKVKGVQQLPWEEFEKKLKKLEKKYDVSLLGELDQELQKKTKEEIMPFKKGDVVKATLVCWGRTRKEGVVVAKNRSILTLLKPATTSADSVQGKKVTVKILQAKHNVFFGKEV